MTIDPDEPVTLVRVANGAGAVAIANALGAADIQATVTGEYTTGYQTGAPGYADVLVKRVDLERARAAWEEIQQQGDFDWTDPQVEAEVVAESPPPDEEELHPERTPLWQTTGNRLVWISALIGVAIGVFVWLFTGSSAALWIWAFAVLGAIALLMALNSLGRSSQRSESDDTYTRGE